MRTLVKLSALLVLVLFVSLGCATVRPPSALSSGQHPTSFQQEIVKTVGADFLLYLPDGYESSQERWPLLLFLHGAGERGDDLNRVEKHGPPKLIAEGRWSYPFIVVSPQCPEEDWWSSGRQIDVLTALLDHVESTCRVDKDRIYVTGLSMGGFGSWRLACEHPDRFAALAPICGRGDPYRARAIRHLPVWVFHGAKDEVVPLAASQEMVDALEKAGGKAAFTVYPEAGHDSWSATYDNPALYEWFLSHTRGSAKAQP